MVFFSKETTNSVKTQWSEVGELGDTAFETYVSSKDVTMFSQYLLYGSTLDSTIGDPVGRV